MKNTTCHTVGTVPKSNRKFKETEANSIFLIQTPRRIIGDSIYDVRDSKFNIQNNQPIECFLIM